MKKWHLLIVLAVVFFVLSFVPLHHFLPSVSRFDGYYDLAPGNVNGPSSYLFYGMTAVLDAGIQGANRDVYFYITDSSGKRVFDAGRVYDGYHLEWIGAGSDTFKFNFDNTMSLISHKNVDYSLHVYPYPIVFLLLGVLFLLVGIWQIFREENLMARIKAVLFKKPESQNVTCEYCGATFNKTLDKCPNCGARKKIEKSKSNN